MFEWAGISFGEDQVWRIQKSIKRLATLSGATSLRFWGKLYGVQRDYYVVEGSLNQAEESNVADNVEKRGAGTNALVFWVTDNVLEDWIQLPDLKPEHLEAARKIKHVLTGDLNASIDSNPPFPGKERHFLRA